MSFWSSELRCPYCGETLHVETGTTVEEWLTYLKPLKVSRRDFKKHHQELSKIAGGDVSPNDVIWRILNSLVGKYAGNREKLCLIYAEMAELVASELRDPTLQLDLAARYGIAILRRNKDPIDIAVVKYYEAYDLERESKIDEAISIYKFMIKHRLPDDRPYERLRILYTRQKKYRDAIRVCKAFIKSTPKDRFVEKRRKFAEWIPKLEQKIERQKVKR